MRTNGISVLLIVVATIYVVLYLSHKIAGPLFKFEKVTQSIGDGDLTINPKLRKADELKSMSDSYEYLLKKWKDRVRRVAEAQKSLEEINGELKNEKLNEINAKLTGVLKEITVGAEFQIFKSTLIFSI